MHNENKTYIVRKSSPLESLISTNDPSQWEEFLEKPAGYIAEAITGLLETGPSLTLAGAAAGRIVQAALKAQLYRRLGEELKELREKGRIKAPEDTRFGFASWKELLQIIDEETPDEERLEALKAMFLAINRVNSSDAESIVAYQLFQISKKLTSGELLLLKAVLAAYRTGAVPDMQSAYGANWIQFDFWAQAVSKLLGGTPISLIELHEKSLINLQLISDRHPQDRHVVSTIQARLTDLGLRFCEQIERYEREAC